MTNINNSNTENYYPLFSSEDACAYEDYCDSFIETSEEDSETQRENLFALHRQAFFAYDPGATLEDWKQYVENNSDLLDSDESPLEEKL